MSDDAENTGGDPGESVTTETTGKNKTFTQDELNRHIADRINREKAAAAAAKAEHDAALALVQADLTAAQAELTRYQAAIAAMTADRMKHVPAPIKTLLEALDPLAQMEWLAANAETIAQPAGVPPSPEPAGNGTQPITHEALAAKARSGQYGF